MKFPMIKEIATTDVVKVDINSSLNDSIDKMYDNNHRSVVVIGQDKFYILTANNLLKLKLDSFCFDLKLKDVELEEIPSIDKDQNILDSLYMIESNNEYFCAVNNDGSLYGIVTYTDVISNIDPETLMENYRLSDLINMNKDVQKISKDEPTSKVLEDMVSKDYDCVVILEDEKPIGIITTKDIMTLMKLNPDLSLPVSNYMSTPVQTLDDSSSIKEAISFMKKKDFKRIVVVNKKSEFTGLILQKELISLSYSKWAVLMKEYSTELTELNNLLEKKNKSYEKMASFDQLTGLYNRYKFTEIFVSEYHTMVQRDNKMSLMILDLDHFKTINDTYGHNTGDKVLVQISNMLLKHLRNVDVVGRWGGEEFLVLLPTADIKNSEILANKLREYIAEHELDEHINATVSIGITEIKIGDDIKDTIKRADEALYEAKNSGRNCVKVKL